MECTMIKLFSLKQQKKDGEASGKTAGSSKRTSAAYLRIQKGDHNTQLGSVDICINTKVKPHKKVVLMQWNK